MALKIFYTDDDLNTLAGVAILKVKHPGAKLFKVDSPDNFPLEVIDRMDALALIGFCPTQFDIMEKVIELSSVLWVIGQTTEMKEQIERHDLHNRIYFPSKALVSNKYAICELAYPLLNNNKKANYFLTLLGRYAISDYSDDNTIPFYHALKAWFKPNFAEMQQWSKLINLPRPSDEKYFLDLIKQGKLILSYIKRENEILAEKECFETKFKGKSAIAVNRPYVDKDFFDSIHKKQALKICFGIQKDKWRTTIYSDTVDVLDLAKEYNPKGNKNVVSFTTDINVIKPKGKKVVRNN